MIKSKTKSGPRMSDEAVAAKTGKNWKQWFAIIDKAGGKKMSHQEIVKLLDSKHNVGPWWCQMVTVTYEQQTGLRETHEKPDGFQISVSRTVNVPISKLYDSFANDEARSEWLSEDGLVVRKAATNKSMRVTWKDGKTTLEINFLAKVKNKSQVVVQHSKLPNAAAATRMKTYWGKALDRLRASLES
jgi:Domain of unknown function (DUF4287)/Activator of Hsp90 ATPase homolog 1-like protein